MSVFEGGWYAASRMALPRRRVRRMLMSRGPIHLNAAGAIGSTQAWVHKPKVKPVVLCRRPPNKGLEGSAQQRPAVGFPPRFARRRPLSPSVSPLATTSS